MKENKTLEKRKNDMIELWKEVFHDSDNYIKLVFDTYFVPDNAFTVYEGEKLIAALLGVEYTFKIKNNNGHKEYLKSLYLCGLATRPEYRRLGIMANLMRKAEISAKERGFAFTFLIPADTHLREYYEKKGYKTASYLSHQPIEIRKSGTTDKMNIYTIRDLFKKRKFEFIRELAQWCSDIEKEDESSSTIIHSRKDMVTIMEENENSFLITNSTFDLKYPNLAKVMAVVFPTPSDQEKSRIWNIVGLYLKEGEGMIYNNDPENKLPDYFKETLIAEYPDRIFNLNLPYTGRLDKNMELCPYSMIKPTGIIESFTRLENQTFKIYLMLD